MIRRAFFAAALVASVLCEAAPRAGGLDNEPVVAPTLRITSPLGRTGLPGTIRIVARLDGVTYPRLGLAEPKPVPVRFLVDNVLLSTDQDGAPYDALWVDDNPFEARELTAEADLPSGTTLRTSITLNPLEITDTAEISSVAVDATVVDSKGRFVNNLTAREFTLQEDGKPQALDLVTQNREPALFTLLIDSSQSMKIRSSAVRATAVRLLASIAAEDQVVVAPFSRTVTSVTGPTTDRGTVLDAIAAIRHQGGTAILDAVGETATLLAGGTRRRAVVLITDAYDENSESGFDATMDKLKKSGVTLYVVGVGGIAGVSYNGEALLKRLCEETGGRAWFPRDDQQLGRAYEAIAGEVHQKYFMTGYDRGLAFGGGAKYLFSTPGSSVRPYVGAGPGLMNIRRTIYETNRGEISNEVLAVFGAPDGNVNPEKEGSFKPTVQFMAGAGFAAGRTYVDIGYRFNRVYKTAESLSFSAFKVGVGMRF